MMKVLMSLLMIFAVSCAGKKLENLNSENKRAEIVSDEKENRNEKVENKKRTVEVKRNKATCQSGFVELGIDDRAKEFYRFCIKLVPGQWVPVHFPDKYTFLGKPEGDPQVEVIESLTRPKALLTIPGRVERLAVGDQGKSVTVKKKMRVLYFKDDPLVYYIKLSEKSNYKKSLIFSLKSRDKKNITINLKIKSSEKQQAEIVVFKHDRKRAEKSKVKIFTKLKSEARHQNSKSLINEYLNKTPRCKLNLQKRSIGGIEISSGGICSIGRIRAIHLSVKNYSKEPLQAPEVIVTRNEATNIKEVALLDSGNPEDNRKSMWPLSPEKVVSSSSSGASVILFFYDKKMSGAKYDIKLSVKGREWRFSYRN